MIDSSTHNNQARYILSPSSEVTFHVANPDGYRPLQWVAGISVNGDDWHHANAEGQIVGQLTANLPVEMSANLMRFAQEHLDPDTDRDYWCHTFAEAVGYAALESVSGLPHGLENTKEGLIFSTGTKIEPAKLAIGEWGVVADPRTEGGHISHSMVGIGPLRDANNGYTRPLAIQIVDQGGGLYIGDPNEYIQHELKRAQRAGGDPAQTSLYVKR